MAEQGGDQRLVGRPRDCMPKRFQRLLRPPGLEQDLALQLEEIGIVRPVGEQAVGLGEGPVGMMVAVPGISAGVARRHRAVAFRIAVHHLARVLDEADQLGAHALEALFERRIGGAVPGRVLLVDMLERLRCARR